MNIQLSRVQLFLLMFIMQTGFVYTSFQNLIIEHSKRDATLQFLVIAVIFFLQLLFFEKMYTYFILTRITKILYIVYWTIFIIVFVNYITYILSTWVFIKTPNTVLIFMFLFVCYYASISRPETAVNIGAILLPMLVIFILFMFLAVPDLHGTNLLPLFKDRSNTWWLGFVYSTYAFGGAEMYVMLRKYLIKSESEKINKKLLLLYFSILTIFYLMSITFTLMFFAINEISLVPEPIFYILHSIEITFVKRLDLFFIYIWLSWSIIAIINYVLVIRLVYFEKKRKAPRLKLFIYFTFIGVLSTFLTRYSVLEFFKHYSVYMIIVFSFFVPIIIIVANKIRGRKVLKSDTSS